MDLSWIDWLIILVPLGAVFWIGYQAQRCVKGVADFLSAGRAAGRYLLSVGRRRRRHGPHQPRRDV